MSEDRLPEAELEVLAALHRFGAATARQVREALEPYRPMAHGSVVTLLSRLEAKKLVRRRKGDAGKAFVYEPRSERASTVRPVMRNLVQRVFGGDSVALVESLFETKPPTSAELEELQELLDRLRAERSPTDTGDEG